MDIYKSSLEPSYEDIGENLAIRPSGILVRKGLYRNALLGAQYEAVTLASRDDECVFCEPKLSDRQNITYAGKHFAAFSASAPYEFMGDNPVITDDHELVVPLKHVEDPDLIDDVVAKEINEYLHDRETQQPTITYVRNQGSPSKSVRHLHYHSMPIDTNKKVSLYTYSIHSGVTSLQFSQSQESYDNESMDEILSDTELLTISKPVVPFAHFDGQQVLGHLRLKYDSQNPESVKAMNEQLTAIKREATDSQSFQTYSAYSNQDIKIVEALYLGFNPVYKIEYDKQRGGIAELVFARLSLETISKIKQSRNK